MSYDPDDAEVDEAFAEWYASGLQPEREILSRVKAREFFVLVERKKEPPYFSREEKRSLKKFVKQIAQSVFEGRGDLERISLYRKKKRGDPRPLSRQLSKGF